MAEGSELIGGDANSTYLVIADLGLFSGQGLDCRYYILHSPG